MPNIEIHGMQDEADLQALKGVIRGVLEDLDLINEAVITTVPSVAEDCASTTSKPYVRIVSSDRGEAKRIAETLHGRWRAIDIEYLHLDGFIAG